MKRSVSFFALFAMLLFDALAIDFSFSLSPLCLGFSTGKFGEYILYENDSPVSFLDWRERPASKIGITASLSVKNLTIFVSASANGFQKCGKMYDSDWNEDGLKYIYSENDAYSASGLSFCSSARYDFWLKNICLSPAIEFLYEHNSLTAKNGRGWYGAAAYSENGEDVAWTDENAHYYARIAGYSTYKLYDFYALTGICAGFWITPFVFLRVSTLVAPFSYTYSKDVHYRKSGLASKYVLAAQTGIFSRFKQELECSVTLNSRSAVSINASFLFGPQKKGKYAFYQNASTEKESFYLLSKGKSASDLLIFSAGICTKIIF